MKRNPINTSSHPSMERAASYGKSYRQASHPLHPSATTQDLRQRFCVPLQENSTGGEAVINELITAAEPGLVGNTDPNFYAWVMGGSDPVGVAADWLTSVWGQNAAIFQTSPAAAIAEEAVSAWLLEMLELPEECSVGLVTGATMAGFVGLSAARSEVLARFGHNFERDGLQGAPFMRIYLSDDTHVSNLTALRHLGFGEANIVRIASDTDGLMNPDELASVMSETDGPKIIVATAGHINSGGFEDFATIAKLAKRHNAWLHIDGAFGLWARVLPEKNHLTKDLDLADSWSVDGHKWLQIPYDSGFAIVKNPIALKKAMDTSAGYLNRSDDDGRNPTEFNPELSRRARGFAAWAVFRALGKSGIRKLISNHCQSAKAVADNIRAIPGLNVTGTVDLNQICISVSNSYSNPCMATRRLADDLNASGAVFVRTAKWKGREVLRLSLSAHGSGPEHAQILSTKIEDVWNSLRREL